jgi:hypothetical protein
VLTLIKKHVFGDIRPMFAPTKSVRKHHIFSKDAMTGSITKEIFTDENGSANTAAEMAYSLIRNLFEIIYPVTTTILSEKANAVP